MKAKKTWENVYALRQEYNPYQKKWFPCVLSWNTAHGYSWIDGVFTEDGKHFYIETLNKCNYSDVTKRGISKCDPEDVKAIMEYFREGQEDINWQEVEKLSVFYPRGTSTLII